MPQRGHAPDGRAVSPRSHPDTTLRAFGRATSVAAAVALVLVLAGCQGASRETLAADYLKLAQASNDAYGALVASLGSTNDPATRAPMLRGLADAEKAYADGLASLPASGDVKAAIDDVVRLSRERDAAFRAAADAKTGAEQEAALAAINGPRGDAFGAAVAKLRELLGLPSTSPGPSGSAPPSASPAGVVPTESRGANHRLAADGARATTTAATLRSQTA